MISMQILSPHKPTLSLRKCLLLISRCHDMYQKMIMNQITLVSGWVFCSLLICGYICIYPFLLHILVCVYVYIYICMCVCVYIYIYVYVCIHVCFYMCVWECVLKNGFTFTNSRPRVVVMLTFSSLAGPGPVFIDVLRLRWWPLVVILRALGSRFVDVQTYGQLSR